VYAVKKSITESAWLLQPTAFLLTGWFTFSPLKIWSTRYGTLTFDIACHYVYRIWTSFEESTHYVGSGPHPPNGATFCPYDCLWLKVVPFLLLELKCGTVTSAPFLPVFRLRLNTYLFCCCYDIVWLCLTFLWLDVMFSQYSGLCNCFNCLGHFLKQLGRCYLQTAQERKQEAWRLKLFWNRLLRKIRRRFLPTRHLKNAPFLRNLLRKSCGMPKNGDRWIFVVSYECVMVKQSYMLELCVLIPAYMWKVFIDI